MQKSEKTPNLPFLTPNDVATMSGKTLAWIHHNIRNGKLQATNIGGRYFIAKEDYDRWYSDLRPVGRPKK